MLKVMGNMVTLKALIKYYGGDMPMIVLLSSNIPPKNQVLKNGHLVGIKNV